MKAFPFSGLLFIVVAGVVVLVVGGGAGRARRGGFLTGACALRQFSDSALEREYERERRNGLLLMPNASASIDRVERSLVLLLTNMYRPSKPRSIHVAPDLGSMKIRDGEAQMMVMER